MIKIVSIIAMLAFSSFVFAERPIFKVILKQHLFYPDQFVIPANTKVKLIVINQDQTPEQFDSFDLNREKVIFQNSQGVIFIGPLTPGEYHFFGEYHQNSAIGKIIVLENKDAH